MTTEAAASTIEVAQALIDAALKLPPDARAAIALEVLNSLEAHPDVIDEYHQMAVDDPPQTSPEWAGEIQRRIQEIERGEAELIDADEVFRELREMYPGIRS